MNKKILSLALLSVLLLAVYFQRVSTFEETIKIPDIDHMRVALSYEPETVDPHKARDVASRELIFNVYETLVFFNYERIDEYECHIATTWSIIDPQTYRFYLRSGVKWHDPAYGTVTKEDVEYSFERGMVQDFVGGPMRLFYEPLIGVFNSKHYCTSKWPDAEVEKLGHLIDNAIVSGIDGGGDYVQFNLVKPYAPFLQTLCGTWSSIIDYEWSTAQGAWPGPGVAFADRWGDYISWKNHNQRYNHAVKVSFDKPTHVMMGSGPYKFDTWVVSDYWRVTKFDDYWGGWPGLVDYVDMVTVKLVEHWPTRKMMFLRGEVDLCDVPQAYIEDVEDYYCVRCVKDLPTLSQDPLHYNYNVSSTTQYFAEKPKLAGSEKLDLLNDIHMRKAISHCLDFATLISAAYLGEAVQAATPMIKGLTFNWEELGKTPWAYDLALAKAEFQAAWGGDAWTDGFSLPIVYYEGNIEGMMACTMIEYAIENLITGWETLPVITTHGLPYGAVYIPAFIAGELPVWEMSYQASFADAHDLASAYMHPYGDFAYFQSVEYGQSGWMQKTTIYDPVTGNPVSVPFGDTSKMINNTYMMHLIEYGIEKPLYWERRAIYNELQDIWLEEYVSLCVQPSGRHWERCWVQQWYHNILYPGLYCYFYHLWKGLDADITGDNYVDISDASKISAHWYTPPFPAGPLGYHRNADIYPVSEMDGADYLISGADGKVNILDASLINAQWHDEAVDP